MDRTGAALLQTIRDNPGDDLPKLVFADWIEENGQPLQAELVRVDVALWNARKGTKRFKKLDQRWNELIADPAVSVVLVEIHRDQFAKIRRMVRRGLPPPGASSGRQVRATAEDLPDNAECQR